jgi:hypothetical protein
MNAGDWITALLTASLVLITAYYAWQTRNAARLMREANELQNRPVVSISLKERRESISFIDFIVTNAGNGLARDISFTVQGKNLLIKEMGERKETVKDLRVIKNGIRALAPSESRSYWFMSVMGRIEEIKKTKTKISVSYYGNDKDRLYEDVFDLDFLSLPEYSLGDDPLYKTGKELEKIRKEIERIRRDQSRS